MRISPFVALLGVTPLILASSWQNDGDKGTGVLVIAEGAGTTAEEALKDAFRQAIRQVVGAMVDAETLVKNDEVVSDKVLTYSDGIVKKYEELSKKQENGLFRVRIRAIVERRSLVARLKAANVVVTELDGKSLFAELVTDLEGRKTAKELVAKALEGFPINCIQAEPVGKPKIDNKGQDAVTVNVRVKISVKAKEYKTFSERLIKTLDGLKTPKSETGLQFTSANRTLCRPPKTARNTWSCKPS